MIDPSKPTKGIVEIDMSNVFKSIEFYLYCKVLLASNQYNLSSILVTVLPKPVNTLYHRNKIYESYRLRRWYLHH